MLLHMCEVREAVSNYEESPIRKCSDECVTCAQVTRLLSMECAQSTSHFPMTLRYLIPRNVCALADVMC